METLSSMKWSRIAGMCTLLAALCCTGIKPADARPNADLLTDIPVTGTSVDTLTSGEAEFTGDISLTGIQFDANANQFILTGNITGTTDQVTSTITDLVFVTTGTLESINQGKHKSGQITLDLGTIDLPLAGLTVELADVTIDVGSAHGRARHLGNMLRKIAHFLEKGDASQVSKTLDKISPDLKNPLTNLEVTGTANTSGTFTGFVNIDRLDVDTSGTVNIVGTLNGVAQVNGETINLMGEIFMTSATLYGAGGKGKHCGSMFVDFGIIDVTSLDLQLDLADVLVADSTHKGQAKKFAKLLCKVSQSISDIDENDKPKKAEKRLKKLNKYLTKVNQELFD